MLDTVVSYLTAFYFTICNYRFIFLECCFQNNAPLNAAASTALSVSTSANSATSTKRGSTASHCGKLLAPRISFTDDTIGKIPKVHPIGWWSYTINFPGLGSANVGFLVANSPPENSRVIKLFTIRNL